MVAFTSVMMKDAVKARLEVLFPGAHVSTEDVVNPAYPHMRLTEDAVEFEHEAHDDAYWAIYRLRLEYWQAAETVEDVTLGAKLDAVAFTLGCGMRQIFVERVPVRVERARATKNNRGLAFTFTVRVHLYDEDDDVLQQVFDLQFKKKE